MAARMGYLPPAPALCGSNSTSVTVEDDSVLVLPSSPNFRDLGGYVGADGRQVRTGLLFRSGGFHRLTLEEIAAIQRYGFRLRCDLRSEAERNTTPNHWPDSPEPGAVLSLDMGADPRAANRQFFAELMDNFTPAGAFNAMCTLQRHMPTAIRRDLGSLFDSLIEQGRLPAVIHCHHGKDRTGFVAAVILLALGVAREQVLDDYQLSNSLCDKDEAAAGMRLTIEQYTGKIPGQGIVDQLAISNPAYLASALEQIDRDYGGIDQFLESAAGLDAGRLARFRDILLEDPRGK